MYSSQWFKRYQNSGNLTLLHMDSHCNKVGQKRLQRGVELTQMKIGCSLSSEGHVHILLPQHR